MWTPAQVAQFLEYTDNHQLSFVWRLALLRGFRRGELCGMADEDMGLDAATITVNVALLQVGHSTTRITEDLYQHVRVQVQIDAAETTVALLPDAKSTKRTGT